MGLAGLDRNRGGKMAVGPAVAKRIAGAKAGKICDTIFRLSLKVAGSVLIMLEGLWNFTDNLTFMTSTLVSASIQR